MAERDGGSIVCTASTASFMGEEHQVAYNASKGAVSQLARSMAIDLAPFGIRVNAVAPGWVDTPRGARVPGRRRPVVEVPFEHRDRPSRRPGRDRDRRGVPALRRCVVRDGIAGRRRRRHDGGVPDSATGRRRPQPHAPRAARRLTVTISLGVDTLCWHMRLEAGAIDLEEVLADAGVLGRWCRRREPAPRSDRSLGAAVELASFARIVRDPRCWRRATSWARRARAMSHASASSASNAGWRERSLSAARRCGSPPASTVRISRGEPELIERERAYVTEVLRRRVERRHGRRGSVDPGEPFGLHDRRVRAHRARRR